MITVLAGVGACFLIMVASGLVLWLAFVAFRTLGHSKLLQHRSKKR